MDRRLGPRQLQGHDHVELQVDEDHPDQPDHVVERYTGELTNMAFAADGRIFYTGRAICSQTYAQISNWNTANVGLGCGTVHVYDPSVPVSAEPDASRINQVANLSVFGAMNGGAEHGQSTNNEEGLLGDRAGPRLQQGPPVHLPAVLPVLRRRAGQEHRAGARHGLRPQLLPRRAPPVALHLRRRDAHARAGSEKVIMSWDPVRVLLLPRGLLDGVGLQGQPVHHRRRTWGQQPPTPPTAATPTPTRR